MGGERPTLLGSGSCCHTTLLISPAVSTYRGRQGFIYTMSLITVDVGTVIVPVVAALLFLLLLLL